MALLRTSLLHAVPAALVVAAFLPYLPGGLRTEHLVGAVGTALALVAFLAARWRVPWPTVAVVATLVPPLAAVLVSSALSPRAGAAAPVAAGFLRVALPLLLAIACAYALEPVPERLRRSATAIVRIAVPVALVAMASAVTDLSGLLAPWVRDGDGSVWTQALAIGRFTGVFNQPLEAGTFFTVAACAVVYLRAEGATRGLPFVSALATIVVGGALSLSKNFLVVGLGCAFGLAVWLGVLTVTGAMVRGVLAVLLLGAALLRFAETYVTSLLDLFETGGLLIALTAGRFGSGETDVAQLFAELARQGNWIAGFGLGAHLPLDNGYLEYYYQGGIVALAGYVSCLAALVLMGLRARHEARGRIVLALTAYVTVASFGGPVLTANRANVALLVLLTACLLRPAPATRG
jgi:hypothetical protein